MVIGLLLWAASFCLLIIGAVLLTKTFKKRSKWDTDYIHIAIYIYILMFIFVHRNFEYCILDIEFDHNDHWYSVMDYYSSSCGSSARWFFNINYKIVGKVIISEYLIYLVQTLLPSSLFDINNTFWYSGYIIAESCHVTYLRMTSPGHHLAHSILSLFCSSPQYCVSMAKVPMLELQQTSSIFFW